MQISTLFLAIMISVNSGCSQSTDMTATEQTSDETTTENVASPEPGALTNLASIWRCTVAWMTSRTKNVPGRDHHLTGRLGAPDNRTV